MPVTQHRIHILILATAYFLAGAFLHLKISLLLITPVVTGTGTTLLPASFLPWLLIASAVLLGVDIVRRASAGTNRLTTLFYWAVWLVCAALVDRFLVFKSIEYVHYPQYAGLAILIGMYLDPERRGGRFITILFWTFMLSVLDEVNQYLYLCKSYGDYLDFNDFILNLLGSIAGLLIFYGFRTGCDIRQRRQMRMTAFMKNTAVRFTVVAGVLILLLSLSGRMKTTPPEELPPGGLRNENGRTVLYLERKPGLMGNWNAGERHGRYYVLTPMQGSMLVLLISTVFATFTLTNRKEFSLLRKTALHLNQ